MIPQGSEKQLSFKVPSDCEWLTTACSVCGLSCCSCPYQKEKPYHKCQLQLFDLCFEYDVFYPIHNV